MAIHLARGAIAADECHAGLAAGTQCQLLPSTFGILSQLQALSADGRCKTFSTAADGYGRGEGFAVCVLEARRPGGRSADHRPAPAALVVVAGSAVNQDGRSSSFTAPHGPAQQALLAEALAASGVSPEAVAYLASHGTGTALGDPIETGAAAKVLLPRGTSSSGTPVLAVGAVKVRSDRDLNLIPLHTTFIFLSHPKRLTSLCMSFISCRASSVTRRALRAWLGSSSLQWQRAALRCPQFGT